MIEQTEQGGMDLGQVTHVCPCGSQFWNVQAAFHDYMISAYLLPMTCVVCGNSAIAPTECDRPA